MKTKNKKIVKKSNFKVLKTLLLLKVKGGGDIGANVGDNNPPDRYP